MVEDEAGGVRFQEGDDDKDEEKNADHEDCDNGRQREHSGGWDPSEVTSEVRKENFAVGVSVC